MLGFSVALLELDDISALVYRVHEIALMFIFHPSPNSTAMQLPSMPHVPLQVHRRQTQYFTPLLVLQLLAHNAIHPRSNRLASLIDQNASIIIEPHNAPIRSLILLLRPHHDRMPDIAASDLVRCGDGDGTARFRTEASLLLNDYYYSVACMVISGLCFVFDILE